VIERPERGEDMSGPQQDTLLAGRYRLAEVIGRGGMGEVWRATDELLHREVAVKTLPGPAARAPGAAERFRREALAVARLNQRRVASVFDFLEVDGVSYIVMELLDGQSLAARLERQPVLPAGEAAEIVAQAAEGLQAAHDAGITHRDVKPANIMLTTHGVKLLDFGLAATTWDAGLTSTGMMVGTLGYISPERAAGGPGTEAGDIYALGVVLFQALTGHLPFPADNPLALVQAQASATAPALPAGTPPQLAAACLRALAHNPADRFPTAAAFAAAVRGQAPPGEPPTTQLPVAAAARRRPVRLVLLGALVLAVLTAAAVYFWPGDSGQAPPDDKRTAADAGGKRGGQHKRTAVAAAFRTLLDDVTEGAKAGDIEPEAAKDVAKAAKDMRKQLANGETDDFDSRLDDIDRRIDDHAREEKITPETADTLHTDIREIADAAERTP
jgi:eukaryotic-like serine/threonine-protein kinase